ASVLDWKRLDPPREKLDLAEAGVAGEPARLRELLGGEVDSDHRALPADLERGEERVHAGSAAEVDHALALLQLGQVEEVADAGERLGRSRGHAVEDLARVAEPVRERASELEVVVARGLLRD